MGSATEAICHDIPIRDNEEIASFLIIDSTAHHLHILLHTRHGVPDVLYWAIVLRTVSLVY